MNGQKEPRSRDVRGALGKKTKNPLDDWVDKENLAIHFGYDEETITNWQKMYGLPFVKLGRITLFSLLETNKFLKGRLVTVCPENLGQKEGQKKEGTIKKGRGR